MRRLSAHTLAVLYVPLLGECLQTVSQVSPIYLKRQVLCANVYHRSRVNGTFFLYPQKHVLCPRISPDRSQIGLGLDWVGLESLTRDASPKDCWTSFPTDYFSTVESNWSVPLVQSWSVSQWNLWWWTKRWVWFFIQNLSNLQSFNFWNATSWKCSLKNNCIRSCLIEHQFFPWFQDQYRPKIPRLDVSSILCACIVRDVVQRSQYILGLCDFHFLDQQIRRTLFVFFSNFDLQVPSPLLIME